MKRFRGWVFNGFAVLMLGLCLFSMALWVRSYWINDTIMDIQYFPLDGHHIPRNWIPDLPKHYSDDPPPIAVERSIDIASLRGECRIGAHQTLDRMIFADPGWIWLHPTAKGALRQTFLWMTEYHPDAVFVTAQFPI